LFPPRNPIAALESALDDLRSTLVGDPSNPDSVKADERLAGAQRALAGADEAVAALGAQNNEAQDWLAGANDLAAREREAERLNQAMKDVVPAIEQLRAALDNFIATIAPLGEAGATAAAAATDFRETIRDSAAEALHLGAQRKHEILTNVTVPLQPAAGTESAEEKQPASA
jgi:ABC-type transporter Mla subunit MlaD